MALHYKTYMAKFLEGGFSDTHVCYISLTVSQDSKYFQDPWFLGTGLTLIIQTLASILQLPNSSSNHKLQSPGPWITIKLHLFMLSWDTVTSSSIVIVGFFFIHLLFQIFKIKWILLPMHFNLKKNLFSLITHQTKIDGKVS